MAEQGDLQALLAQLAAAPRLPQASSRYTPPSVSRQVQLRDTVINSLRAAPSMQNQIKAAAAGQAPVGGAAGGIGKLLVDNPISKVVLGGITAIDTGRRMSISALQEIKDALDGDPATRASFGDFGKQVADPTFGFGRVFPMGGWKGRLVGFAGDTLLDPLTYATFGASVAGKQFAGAAAKIGTRYVAGRAGSEALARAVLREGGSAVEAGAVALRGRSALSQEMIQKLGMPQHGIYFFGSRIRMPGTTTLGRLGASGLASMRTGIMNTKFGQKLMRTFTPGEGPVQAQRILLRMKNATTEERERAIVFLQMHDVGRATSNITRSQYEQYARQFFDDPDIAPRRADLYKYMEKPPETWASLPEEYQRALGKARAFYDARWAEVNQKMRFADPDYEIGQVRDYFPHMMTDQAGRYMDDATRPYVREMLPLMKQDLADPAGAFRSRALGEGQDWFGHKLTQADIDGGIDRLNQLFRQQTNSNFDFFETDLFRVTAKYGENYSRMFGLSDSLVELRKYPKFARLGTEAGEYDAAWVSAATRAVSDAAAAVDQSLKSLRGTLGNTVGNLRKLTRKQAVSLEKAAGATLADVLPEGAPSAASRSVTAQAAEAAARDATVGDTLQALDAARTELRAAAEEFDAKTTALWDQFEERSALVDELTARHQELKDAALALDATIADMVARTVGDPKAYGLQGAGIALDAQGRVLAEGVLPVSAAPAGRAQGTNVIRIGKGKAYRFDVDTNVSLSAVPVMREEVERITEQLSELGQRAAAAEREWEQMRNFHQMLSDILKNPENFDQLLEGGTELGKSLKRAMFTDADKYDAADAKVREGIIFDTLRLGADEAPASPVKTILKAIDPDDTISGRDIKDLSIHTVREILTSNFVGGVSVFDVRKSLKWLVVREIHRHGSDVESLLNAPSFKRLLETANDAQQLEKAVQGFFVPASTGMAQAERRVDELVIELRNAEHFLSAANNIGKSESRRRADAIVDTFVNLSDDTVVTPELANQLKDMFRASGIKDGDSLAESMLGFRVDEMRELVARRNESLSNVATWADWNLTRADYEQYALRAGIDPTGREASEVMGEIVDKVGRDLEAARKAEAAARTSMRADDVAMAGTLGLVDLDGRLAGSSVAGMISKVARDTMSFMLEREVAGRWANVMEVFRLTGMDAPSAGMYARLMQAAASDQRELLTIADKSLRTVRDKFIQIRDEVAALPIDQQASMLYRRVDELFSDVELAPVLREYMPDIEVALTRGVKGRRVESAVAGEVKVTLTPEAAARREQLAGMSRTERGREARRRMTGSASQRVTSGRGTKRDVFGIIGSGTGNYFRNAVNRTSKHSRFVEDFFRVLLGGEGRGYEAGSRLIQKTRSGARKPIIYKGAASTPRQLVTAEESYFGRVLRSIENRQTAFRTLEEDSLDVAKLVESGLLLSPEVAGPRGMTQEIATRVRIYQKGVEQDQKALEAYNRAVETVVRREIDGLPAVERKKAIEMWTEIKKSAREGRGVGGSVVDANGVRTAPAGWTLGEFVVGHTFAGAKRVKGKMVPVPVKVMRLVLDELRNADALGAEGAERASRFVAAWDEFEAFHASEQAQRAVREKTYVDFASVLAPYDLVAVRNADGAAGWGVGAIDGARAVWNLEASNDVSRAATRMMDRNGNLLNYGRVDIEDAFPATMVPYSRAKFEELFAAGEPVSAVVRFPDGSSRSVNTLQGLNEVDGAVANGAAAEILQFVPNASGQTLQGTTLAGKAKTLVRNEPFNPRETYVRLKYRRPNPVDETYINEVTFVRYDELPLPYRGVERQNILWEPRPGVREQFGFTEAEVRAVYGAQRSSIEVNRAVSAAEDEVARLRRVYRNSPELRKFRATGERTKTLEFIEAKYNEAVARLDELVNEQAAISALPTARRKMLFLNEYFSSLTEQKAMGLVRSDAESALPAPKAFKKWAERNLSPSGVGADTAGRRQVLKDKFARTTEGKDYARLKQLEGKAAAIHFDTMTKREIEAADKYLHAMVARLDAERALRASQERTVAAADAVQEAIDKAGKVTGRQPARVGTTAEELDAAVAQTTRDLQETIAANPAAVTPDFVAAVADRVSVLKGTADELRSRREVAERALMRLDAEKIAAEGLETEVKAVVASLGKAKQRMVQQTIETGVELQKATKEAAVLEGRLQAVKPSSRLKQAYDGLLHAETAYGNAVIEKASPSAVAAAAEKMDNLVAVLRRLDEVKAKMPGSRDGISDVVAREIATDIDAVRNMLAIAGDPNVSPQLQSVFADFASKWSAYQARSLQVGQAERVRNLAQAVQASGVEAEVAALSFPFPIIGKGAAELHIEGMRKLGQRFPNLFVQEQLGDIINNMQRLRDPAIARELQRFIGPYTRFFKAYATLSPGFHVRNAISNSFMLFAAGAKPRNLAEGLEVSRSLMTALKNGVTYEEWLTTLPEAQRAWANTAFRASAASGGGMTADFIGDTLVAPMAYNNWVTQSSKKFGSWLEQHSRFMLAYDSAKEGFDFDGTVARVRRYLIDYEDVSNADKTLRQIIPFWMWTSRNFPMQVQNIWLNPKAYQIYGNLKRNIMAQDDEEQPMPEWMKNMGAFRLAGTKNLVAMPDLGFTRLQEDVKKIRDPQRLLSELNPLLRLPIELAGERQLYSGIPFSKTPVQVEGSVGGALQPLMQALGYGQTGAGGEKFVSDKAYYALRNLLPFLGQAERLTPSISTYQQRGNVNPLLGYLGVPVREVTPKMSQNELLRRRLAVEQLMAQFKAVSNPNE